MSELDEMGQHGRPTAGSCIRTTEKPARRRQVVGSPCACGVRASTGANVDRNMDRNAIDRRRGSHICRACGGQSGWSNPGHPDSDFACSIGTFMPQIIGFAGNSADADMPEEGLEPPTRGL